MSGATPSRDGRGHPGRWDLPHNAKYAPRSTVREPGPGGWLSRVRLPRLSLHYRAQHLPKGLARLPGRLEVTSDRREALGPLGTPKRPGDVLANLQHAQGEFRQIIGEGDGEIVEKLQRGVSIPVKAFYQVPRLGLGRPPSGSGGQFLGILLQSLTNQGVIPFVQGRSEIRSNLRGARGAGGMGCDRQVAVLVSERLTPANFSFTWGRQQW